MTLPRRWMWLLAIVLVLNFALLGGTQAGEAYACSCAGSPDIAAAYRDADAVFAGEMVRGGGKIPTPKTAPWRAA